MEPPEDTGRSGLRIALLTDTLGDVNGVSRFLNDMADCARARDCRLRIFTSTRSAVREHPNLCNLAPFAHMRLPGYPDLELCAPPRRALEAAVRAFAPRVIHVSTPGPVGLIGRGLARKLGVPLAGTFHTDFPAYVDHLFEEDSLTAVARWFMRWFYKPFAMIVTRSEAYRAELEKLGLDGRRCVRLRPGFHGERFDPRFRDPHLWRSVGIPAGGVKILYVGRVSVEKNMPFLAKVWRECSPRDGTAQLVVVGDGPYRETMEDVLRGSDAYFLGFQSGTALSRVYASGDVFVFPSTTDTLGQVVLESQASGLATLVSDRGGPREVILPGRTGLILRADDAACWARAIGVFIRDAHARTTMGHAAAFHAKAYTIERSFEDFWALHERLAPGPSEEFKAAVSKADQLGAKPWSGKGDSVSP